MLHGSALLIRHHQAKHVFWTIHDKQYTKSLAFHFTQKSIQSDDDVETWRTITRKLSCVNCYYVSYAHIVTNASRDSSVGIRSDSLRAGGSGVRMPVGCENFRTGPDRPWGPPNLLHNGYRVSFSGVKQRVDQPPPSSAQVNEIVTYMTLLPVWSFVARSVVNFTFFIFNNTSLAVSRRPLKIQC